MCLPKRIEDADLVVDWDDAGDAETAPVTVMNSSPFDQFGTTVVNRFLAKTNLQNALGPRSNFAGLTIAEVLDASAAGVTTPGFVPKYDPALRALDWPDGV